MASKSIVRGQSIIGGEYLRVYDNLTNAIDTKRMAVCPAATLKNKISVMLRMMRTPVRFYQLI